MTWLEQNWFGLLGLVVGILGVVASWYFYHVAKRVRQPIFLVDAVRTEILGARRIAEAPIRVLKRTGEEITSDVSAIRFYFWNAGKQSIKREDILENIKIVLESAGTEAEILDPKILKQSRENIIEFSLERNAESPKTTLDVNFRILEHQDGISGQIIYIGDPNAALKVVGTIEGVARFASRPPGTALDAIFGRVPVAWVLLSGMVLTLIMNIIASPTTDRTFVNVSQGIFLFVLCLVFAFPAFSRARPSPSIPSTIVEMPPFLSYFKNES